MYGKSVKHQPQRVGLAHELADEDIGECFPERVVASSGGGKVLWGQTFRLLIRASGPVTIQKR